ncbi:MAG TPA: ATP-binding cassette domain-containing protein [Candidatus Dormibacteraeota bacterium]|nr:ATP-binding cassette domain-containing protein [Candidatus Dormibacteraeota bacterium]
MFLLEARNLGVRYGGVQALDGVTCGVDAGEIAAVIGPNGAGKTTLLNAISGLTPVDQGEILFEGRDLAPHPAHHRARMGLARTLQGVDLFDGLTVRENLLLMARISENARRPGAPAVPVGERVSAAAGFLGVEDELDRQVTALPGGRQRLVDIAAALCLRPRCLLLDEPAAGASPSESLSLGRLLLRIREVLGLGILLIEHDVQMVLDIADYIYVLDFGRLIAEGTPAEIRRDPVVIAAYLGQEAGAAVPVAAAAVAVAAAPASAPPPPPATRPPGPEWGSPEAIRGGGGAPR